MATYQELLEQLNNIRQQMTEKRQEYFASRSKELFASHPTMLAFRWHQYTPYFNDGNSCEFSASTDSDSIQIRFSSLPDDYIDGETGDDEFATAYGIAELHSISYWRDEDKEKRESLPEIQAFRDVGQFLQTFTEDDLKEMFGDHAEITVTPTGAEIDGYDHD